MGTPPRSGPAWRCPYLLMLALLLSIYLAAPFSDGGPLHRAGLTIATCVAMLIGVRASACSPIYWRITVGLASVVALSMLVEVGLAERAFDGWSAVNQAGATLMILVSIIAILIGLLRVERVDTDKIFAAVCVLFMIGILFGFLYTSLDLILKSPPAFDHSHAHDAVPGKKPDASEFFYFSFVTLTTVGYGDVTPSHPLTRTLATLEALLGQIYLTVLIARLVALHILHSELKDSE